MSNPVDEALQTKEALFGGAGKFLGAVGKGLSGSGGRIGESLATGLAGGAAGALGAGAVASVGKLFGAASKRRQFSSMLEANPDLAAQQKRNPKFFNTAYDSIRSMNPTYGKDPVVSGSLMRRMMESPETAGTILMSTMKPPQAQPSGISIEGDFGPVKYRRNL